MAKELTLTLNLAFNKSNISTSMASGTQQFTVSGTDYVRETMSVPTSATALPLGAVATPGYCVITNKDVVNYVDVLDSVSGNACIRLLAGEYGREPSATVMGIAQQSKQELFALNASNFAGTQDPPQAA